MSNFVDMFHKLFPIFFNRNKTNYGMATGSSSSGSSSSQQKVQVTTSSSAQLLSNDLFKGNGVDLSFKGKANANKKRNLTAQPYLGLFQDLNMKGIMYPSVGAISSYTHPTTFGVGNGYNMVPGDFVGTDDNYNTYNNGVNTINWGIGFDSDLKTLTDALSIDFDYCFNCNYGTLTELQSLMAELDCSAVEFGAELPGQMDPDDYVDIVTPFIEELRDNYPGTKIILDAGLVYKGATSVNLWNEAIKDLDADEARYYAQINDRLVKAEIPFSSNMTTNATSLLTYFSTLLPTDLSTFKLQLPNFKMSIGELEVEDDRDNVQYVNNTNLGTSAISRLWEWIIKNQVDVGSVYWMQDKNLIDKNDQTDNNYAILKNIGTLFNGTNKVQSVTFENMSGITGVAVSTGTAYTVLINNTSATVYTPTVYVNGSKKSSTITNKRRYASTWGTTSITGDTISSTTLTIPAYSSCVVSF